MTLEGLKKHAWKEAKTLCGYTLQGKIQGLCAGPSQVRQGSGNQQAIGLPYRKVLQGAS